MKDRLVLVDDRKVAHVVVAITDEKQVRLLDVLPTQPMRPRRRHAR